MAETRFRTRIMFWLHDSKPIGWLLEAPDWFANPALAVIDRLERLVCVVLGHEPIGDQCGRPQHDFCAWCRKSMPFQAKPIRSSRTSKEPDHA